jgi:integrase
MSLAAARAEAAKVMEAARRGEDVAAARKAARAEAQKARLVGETMTDLAERFLESHGPKLAPRTRREYERNLRKDVLPAIGKLGPRDVERAHIRALVEKIAKRAPMQANRTLATLSKLFTWAVSKDLLLASPCVGVEKPSAEHIRDRTYSSEELRAIFAAVRGTDLEHLLSFIGYTAARDSEARSARWPDIDLEEKTWTIRETKQGRAHVLPLSSGALRLLAGIERTGSRFVFPAATRAGYMDRPNDLVFKAGAIKAGLLRNEGTEEKANYVGDNLRLHDLRRTVRTRLSSLGVTPDIAERVLGHAIKGVRRNYDFYDYVNEKRAALEAWCAALDRILAGGEHDGAQVTAFQRRR